MMKYDLTPEEYLHEYRTPKQLTDEHGVTYTAGRKAQSGEPVETIATYLNKRLSEIGVTHVFAIPGDFIAEWVGTLDDPNLNQGLVRVHPVNEMCAGYAADGLARAGTGKVGCIAVTYGVGSLNAVNAVAGAFVESVPVVVINGSPTMAQFNSHRDQGVLWHHMFDGTYTDLRVYQNITAMAVRIDNPTTGPDLIDAALRTCITESKPVYIEIAASITGAPCRNVPTEKLEPSPVPQDTTMLENAVTAVMERLKDAKKLVVLVGVEVARMGLQDDFIQLCKKLKASYLTTLLGKTTISEYEEGVSFGGVFNGRNTMVNIDQLLKSADCVLGIGVTKTDFNFVGLFDNPSIDFPIKSWIQAAGGAVHLGGQGNQYWGAVQLKGFINKICEQVDKLPGSALPNASTFPKIVGSPWVTGVQRTDDTPISWDDFVLHLNSLITQGDVLLADTGMSFYGTQNIRLAQNCFIGQLSWGSIGYSVAANCGVQLALGGNKNTHRVITVTGDTAFGQSVNSIGTLVQYELPSILFVIDNKALGIEQWLVDPKAFKKENPSEFHKYCEIPYTWDYKKIAEGFGGDGYLVKTNKELAALITELKKFPGDKKKFALVAVSLEKTSLPTNLTWRVPSTDKSGST